MSTHGQAPEPKAPVRHPELGHVGLTLHDSSDVGYHKALTNGQIQMIALGGAIGVGLFLGAGSRLAKAGPSLILSYALTGVVAFFLMRALGELVMHRRSSGSFVSYSREFFGARWAFYAGWMYMLNWMTTGIAEITAIAVYISKWSDIPQWVSALVALALVVFINLLSVKAFGTLEFWAAMLKVVALVSFLIVGTFLVLTGTTIAGQRAGLHNLVTPDGFFPNGNTLAFVLAMQGVIFAYATIELVGTAAGEAKDAEHVIPKAVRAVVFRIGIFYVGSIFLLACLLPYTMYKAGESPFVTAFGSMGLTWMGDVMNVVVITAALSSCNSGLYSTGRILRSLAASGEAPKFTSVMNKRGVPSGGVLFTASVYFLGVILNMFLPKEAFEIALETASVGIIWTWITIFACQIALRREINKGETAPTSFPMPGAPYTSWFGIVALLGIIVIMVLDPTNRQFNLTVLGGAALFIVGMVVAWPFVKAKKHRHPEQEHAAELSFD